MTTTDRDDAPATRASDRYERYRRVTPVLLRGSRGQNGRWPDGPLPLIEGFVYPHAMVTAIERGAISARQGDICLRVNGVRVAVLSPEAFALLFAFME